MTRSSLRLFVLAAIALLPLCHCARAWPETASDVSLILAIKDGDDTTAARLLRQGASANATEVGFPGRSALMLAVGYGRTKLAQRLISRGADVNAVDDDGETPLMWALQDPLGATQCVSLLLSHGANVNAADKSGLTPLMYAVTLQGEKVVLGSEAHAGHAAQIDFGADPKAVRLLLAQKALVNARDRRGETALMLAASAGSLPIVKLLVTAGAKVDLLDNAGHDAQWYAAHAGHAAIARYLAHRSR